MTVQPLAFLVIGKDGTVRVLGIPTANNTADRLVNMVPGVIDQVSGLFAKGKPRDTADEVKIVDEDDIVSF